MPRSALDWLALAAGAPVGRLATLHDGIVDPPVDPVADPAVGPAVDLVPFVFAWLADPAPLGRLVHAVDHKPKRHDRLQRLRNIAAHPEVTVLVDHYDEDWSALWWVRVRGRAVVLDPGGDADGLAALIVKYEPYRHQPPAGPMVVIHIGEVRGWSAGVVPDPGGGRR